MPLLTSDVPLCEAHDLVMLDLDGVVYVGADAVPGASDALELCVSHGARIAYLTNNAARPAGEVAQHLRDLGMPVHDDGEVVTSAQAVARMIAADLPSGSRVLVVGGPGLREPLEAAGLVCVDSAEDDPAAVVQGFHRDIGWRHLAEAAYAVAAGLPYYASNLDLSIPTPRGTAPGNGTLVRAGAMIITAGIGKFSPRPLPAGEGWLGRGLEFFVPSFEPYVDKDVVIVGGGDSAFDWAVHLEPIARSVTLVHRRDAFRAHERTVEQVRSSSVRIVTRAEVTALRAAADDPTGPLAEVDVTDPDGVTTSPCQAVVAALGFVADLGPIQQWGVEVHKRHVVVDPSMRTSLERVFAAGDITEYPGKVRLIAVGFGEAATAVNNATVAIDPTAKVFPGHSSEGG